MIYDFTDVILKLSTTYSLIHYTTITHQGMTYTKEESMKSIRGVLVPLTTADREEIRDLGHVVKGKMNFYMPISEGVLVENDEIVDTDGVHWVVIPHDSNYKDTANIEKYRVERKVV